MRSDNTFSYVCALDKDDDPFTDPSCWIKANPLLGVILDHKYAWKATLPRRGTFCPAWWHPSPAFLRLDRVRYDMDSSAAR